VAPRRGRLTFVLQEVFALRRQDRPVLALMAPLFAVVTAASVIVATFTKTAFLAEYAVETLPLMFLGSSLFTAALSIAYVSIAGRFDTARRWLGLVLVAQATFLALHLLYPLAPKAMALAQLIWCTGLSQLLLVQTWNTTSVMLPSRQAKRLFPVFAAVSTLGAAVGGGLVSAGLQVVEARHLMWLVLLLQTYPLWRVKTVVRELQAAADLQDDGASALPASLHRRNQDHESQPFDEVMRGFRAIAATPLLLRLAALVFLLQTASLVIDFQFSTELKLRFTRNEMASFLGSYYAIANTVAFFVALLATSRIVRVVGIGVAISASAIFVGLGSLWYFGAGLGFLGPAPAGFGLGSAFWAIVVTSFLERIFQFALTRNAMQMLVAPLDAKKGERAKTLIDGVVYRVATAGTSVALLFIGPHSEQLALLAPVTLLACLGVVGIGLSMNPHYRRALFEGLRARRVDSDVDPQIRDLLQRSATGEVRERLASSQPSDILAALEIVRESRLPVRVQDLMPAAAHANADIARRALEVVNELGLVPERGALLELLQNERPPAVLREVLRLLEHFPDPSLLPLVSLFIQHEDVGVARLAVAWVHKVGGETYSEPLHRQFRADLHHPEAQRRARAAFISGGYNLETESDLARMVHDPSPEVRLNAVVSMGQVGAMEYVDPLVDSLSRGDLVPAASAALVRFGPKLIPALRERMQRRPPGLAIQLRLLRVVERFGNEAAVRYLTEQVDSRPSVVRNNAVQSLWRVARDPEAPRPPRSWLKGRVLTEIDTLSLLHAIVRGAPARDTKLQFFADEVQALRLQAEMRVFRLLGVLESRAALHRAYLHYRSPQQRVRSNAIELLDQHVVDPDLKAVVGLIERHEGPGADAADALDGPAIGEMLAHADPWLVRVWTWVQTPSGGKMTRDPMDMVFLLKAVPFLSELSGEQLLPIADIVQHVHVEAGDLVFAEGQPGNHLYVILEGEVDVMRGSERVARLGRKECVGEMALLDPAPRSASVKARTDCELLAIARDDFQDLLDMHPALARGIIRVLTQRLRHATEQM
jgi:hypothetical protein